MILATSENLAAACMWRRLWGYGRRGLVVVYGGEVQGWMNELRNPWQLPPGHVAIDGEGRSWTAIGASRLRVG